MRIDWLQHVDFENLGSIGPWLQARGATLVPTALYAGQALPDPRDPDGLIIMGGPMSVNDEDRHPWLAAEKRLAAAVAAAGKPVLGICLGAQIIAAAFGARVFANPYREIGWFAVEQTAAAQNHPLGALLPEQFMAFHWHGETFDLPDGAIHLARSMACRHQAFAIGTAAVGLQFHLETTLPSAQALITGCPQDLRPGPYVQGRQEILGDPRRFAAANALMETVLTWFIGRVRPARP